MPESPTKRPRGRPAVPNDEKLSETVVVRMTAAQKQTWIDRGGAEWLRAELTPAATDTPSRG